MGSKIKRMKGKIIDVWFSCGAASAVAAKRTIDIYGKDNTIRVINNPVIEEHHDNRRFLIDVEKWIGQKIQIAINPKYQDCSAASVWKDRRYMSGVDGAPCTLELKKKARQIWEENNPSDYLVMGFTSEEKGRYDRFKKFERENIIGVLIDEGITKSDCYSIIQNAGIELPKIYKLGYPNANCIGCPKATSPTYWNHVRKVHPWIFNQRAEMSREIGAKLVRVKGERIFLDELDPSATGRPMKNLDFECGIFCEL